MSKFHIDFYECPSCKKKLEYVYWESVNTSLNPELKSRIIDKSIFNLSCECGFNRNIIHPLLYHDMGKNLMIQFIMPEDAYDAKKMFDEIQENELLSIVSDKMRLRIVTDVNYLIEKITIFDSDFDDKVIEVMKCIYKKAYLKTEAPAKDFEFRFCAPDYDLEFEVAHDYHIKLFNYENNTYQILPLDKTKFTKHSEYIKNQEKNREGYDYIIQQEWADSILFGGKKTENGYFSLLDYEKKEDVLKYETEYESIKTKLKDINDLDDNGFTLLKYAVMAEDYDEVKNLLGNGADPNGKMEGNRVVLHWALQHSVSIKIIDLLVEYGADINCMTSRKLKPLDMINERCSVDYLKHMFDLGATCNGERLLRMFAANAQDVECIKFLMEKGFSLEKRDRNDFNANCEAICNNSSNDFLEQFLSIGGNPNEKSNGRPCFFSFIAEYDGEERISGYDIARLKILFAHGADINIKDRFGRTAIVYACACCQRIEMLYFLLRFKPDLSIEDSDGKDVYDYIEENENLNNREKEAIRFAFMMYENTGD